MDLVKEGLSVKDIHTASILLVDLEQFQLQLQLQLKFLSKLWFTIQQILLKIFKFQFLKYVAQTLFAK